MPRLQKHFDDINTDDEGFQWSQVCPSCIKTLKINKSILNDCGGGICGVKGCDNDNTVYINFEFKKDLVV